jgi:hypothetical protein
MFLSKEILTALALISSVNAAVPNTRTSLERRATQSCHITDHGFYMSYSILIRVPYIGRADCDATYNAIEYGGLNNNPPWYESQISNWQCIEKGGYIQLWFNRADGLSTDINTALEWCYPSVDKFNCPDH